MKNLYVLSLVGFLLFSKANAQEVNPLSYLSETNLEDVNRFSKPFSPNYYGSLFQWGRNMPFLYTETYNYVEETVSDNDQRIWGNYFFKNSKDTNGSSIFFWRKDSEVGDTYVSQIKLQKDAPEYYIGDNNFDPCPKGYHMPDRSEITAFFPTESDRLTFNGTGGEILINEEISINGKKGTFKASYYPVQKNVIIGIKFYPINENTLATPYVFKWSFEEEGVKVESVLLKDLSLTAKDYEKIDFSDSDPSYVCRFVPAAGYYNGYDGKAQLRNNYMYLLLNEKAESKSYAPILKITKNDDDWGDVGGFHYDAKSICPRTFGGTIRCVKNPKDPMGSKQIHPNDEVFDKVHAKIGRICIPNAKMSLQIRVYNLDGRLMRSIMPKSSYVEIELPSGKYIVAQGNKKSKVIIP